MLYELHVVNISIYDIFMGKVVGYEKKIKFPQKIWLTLKEP